MVYRLRDIILSLLVLISLCWLFSLICLILWISQKRVFFIQKRTGFQGEVFKMIKFSTLRDVVSGEHEEHNQRKRLTPVGKLLRRFSLDELPQLFNVLEGKMSLVGPRPLIHQYWNLYSEDQKKRFEVLPGITGWAQVKGRNAISFTERFKLDIWYVHHKSLGLDFKILLITVGKFFSGKDVYADDQTTAALFDGTN